MEGPIEVEVLPSPNGARAIVLFRGHDLSPGIGAFDTELAWVTLPSRFNHPRGLPGLYATDPAGAVARPAPRRVASRARAA